MDSAPGDVGPVALGIPQAVICDQIHEAWLVRESEGPDDPVQRMTPAGAVPQPICARRSATLAGREVRQDRSRLRRIVRCIAENYRVPQHFR